MLLLITNHEMVGISISSKTPMLLLPTPQNGKGKPQKEWIVATEKTPRMKMARGLCAVCRLSSLSAVISFRGLLRLVDSHGVLQLLEAAPVSVGVGQRHVLTPPLEIGLLRRGQVPFDLCLPVCGHSVADSNHCDKGRDPVWL